MPHINLPDGLPGIRGPMAFRPETAPAQGATDLEIHDTVLIAAVFCMCNRYVDGLATWAPQDPDYYRQRAAIVAAHGYAASTVTPSTSDAPVSAPRSA